MSEQNFRAITVAAGEAEVGACPVGGEPVAKKIAAIMGSEVGDSKRMTAFVKCAGDCEKAKENYHYTGVQDCTVMPFVPNGGTHYSTVNYAAKSNDCIALKTGHTTEIPYTLT